MRTLTPEEIDALNPGIRSTVLKLREWGFDTVDSGDGKTHEHGCDMPCPYVHIRVGSHCLVEATDSLYFQLAHHAGIDFSNPPNPQEDPEAWAKHPSIEASYSPVDGHAFITLTNVILP